VFAVQGDWGAVVRLLLPGVAVLAVRAIDVPRAVDWAFGAAVFFQGWGNALHLFSEFWWYDNLVHITLPMSLAPILYIGFSRLDVVPDPSERVAANSELLGIRTSPTASSGRGSAACSSPCGGDALHEPAPPAPARARARQRRHVSGPAERRPRPDPCLGRTPCPHHRATAPSPGRRAWAPYCREG
jgi:hypothetical protein